MKTNSRSFENSDSFNTFKGQVFLNLERYAILQRREHFTIVRQQEGSLDLPSRTLARCIKCDNNRQEQYGKVIL